MKRHGPGKGTIGFFVAARWFPGNAEACMVICAAVAFILTLCLGDLAVRVVEIILTGRPPDDKERRR